MTQDELIADMLESHTKRMHAIGGDSVTTMEDLNAERMKHLQDPLKWFKDRGIIPDPKVTEQPAAEAPTP